MIGRSWRSVAPPAAMVAAVLALGAYPTYQGGADVDARRVAAESRMSELQLRAATLIPLAQNGDVLEAQLLALDDLVPADHDIAGFIVELDGIADDLGVQLRDVVPNPSDGGADPATPAGWTSVELSIRIIGGYADLIAFAEATTRTERLAVIDRIGITSSGDGRLDAAFTLRLFRNDNPADALIARYVESRRTDEPTEEDQP